MPHGHTYHSTHFESMNKPHKTVSLSADQRLALEALCRRRKVEALVWKRARAFLLLDAGYELRPCFRTPGYFTPVHERGTKRDTIDGPIRTSIRQQRLSGFMNRARHRAALPGCLVSPAHS